MAKNFTARDMLRFQTCEQLEGCSRLTPAMRYDQAVIAQKLRNFFFTSTLQPSGSLDPNLRLLARTPAFSDAIVLTDIISMFDYPQSFTPLGSEFPIPLEIFEYGGQERSYGLDYFGLTGRVAQRYIMKHEKNRSIAAGFVAPNAVPDLQGRFVNHLPRLLTPFQQLEFDYTAFHPTAATGTIQFTGNPGDTETLTVNGVVFTWLLAPAVGTDIQIGGSAAATAANTLAVLQASIDPLLTVARYTSDFNPIIINVTFKIPGTAGNAFTLSDTSAVVVTPATLTGGTSAAARDNVNLFLQSGLRGVRALGADNPYSYFTASTDREIRDYISGTQPETFFLEATLPIASFPALGATVQIKTPQMERPLLVLGATSNVEGVQAELVDESKYYTFTFADKPISLVAGIPLYKAPPLSVWACNSDFRNPNTYNMWAVPHLLERGSQLIIRLTNGLTPDTTGTFTESIRTKSEQDARIVFLCRTV